MMSTQHDALSELQNIEKKVVTIVRTAGYAIQELTSDSYSMQSVERTADKYFKEVADVDNALRQQIQRLCVNAPYRGITYGEEKDLELLAWRTELISHQLQLMLL
eukprot:Ihof_evm2s61 gene=Ihof_evmTU2s61